MVPPFVFDDSGLDETREKGQNKSAIFGADVPARLAGYARGQGSPVFIEFLRTLETKERFNDPSN